MAVDSQRRAYGGGEGRIALSTAIRGRTRPDLTIITNLKLQICANQRVWPRRDNSGYRGGRLLRERASERERERERAGRCAAGASRRCQPDAIRAYC